MFNKRLNKYNKVMHTNLTAEDLTVAGNSPYTIGTDETFVMLCKTTDTEIFILGLYNETKNPADLYTLATRVFRDLRASGFTRVCTTVMQGYTDSFAKAFKFKDDYKVMTKEL